MKNLLVTGYRAHELQIFNQKHPGIPFIRKAIRDRLVPLIEDGLEWMITPGSYGVDLWACETGIELKQEYPQFKISILAAYAKPEEKWKEERQDYYRSILKDIDYYGEVSSQPYSGGWQLKARDDMLLRKTDGMLLFYDEDAGEGSPRFYRERALKRQQQDGYRIISITAEDVQMVADEANMRFE